MGLKQEAPVRYGVVVKPSEMTTVEAVGSKLQREGKGAIVVYENTGALKDEPRLIEVKGGTNAYNLLAVSLNMSRPVAEHKPLIGKVAQPRNLEEFAADVHSLLNPAAEEEAPAKKRRYSPLPRGFKELTLKELEAVDLLMQGLRPRQIAARMNISIRTLGSHRTQVYEKCSFSGEGELVARLSRTKRYAENGMQRGGEPSPNTGTERLTQREWDVIGLLAKGLTNKEIAKSMQISVRSVGNHLAKIYPKLGVHDRIQALFVVSGGTIGTKTENGSLAESGEEQTEEVLSYEPRRKRNNVLLKDIDSSELQTVLRMLVESGAKLSVKPRRGKTGVISSFSVQINGIVPSKMFFAASGSTRPDMKGNGERGIVTQREYDVAQLVAKGLRNKDIARALCISERTVGIHVSRLYEKLGASRRTDIILWVGKKRKAVNSEKVELETERGQVIFNAS